MAHHRSLHDRRWREVITLCALLVLMSCSAPARPRSGRNLPAASPQTLSSTDPCALRLHDLSGDLLLYYFKNHKLPPDLSALAAAGGDAASADALACPISAQPYVYNAPGLPAPDGKSRMVIYDPAPTHAGRRWAVTIIEPGGDQPLVTDVVAVPEKFFASKDN
jgi:hypothetical protein